MIEIPEDLPRLAPRAPDSHKGDYGRLVLVGGSRGMAGAISLAGKAALRSGAGLVKLGVPDVCLETVASYEPSYMTVPLATDSEGRIVKAAHHQITAVAEEATAMAIGPGLGRSAELTELVGRLYFELTAPMVVDADALNALGERPDLLVRPGGPRILTPHPGELARLVGKPRLDAAERRERALDLALRCRAIVVLKGYRTLITDGHRHVINTTGNPGMATGGSGDVLTGIIVGLLGQRLTPFEAAWLGVFVHGLAGDIAVERLGEVSLIASDLVRFLPKAFAYLEQWDGPPF